MCPSFRRWQCSTCRHQVSLTAGTILRNTKTPLTVWFWAAYLMTTDKRGISALLLQRQFALRRYETAWMMLHKFRWAMVNLEREPLRGEVEVDETWPARFRNRTPAHVLSADTRAIGPFYTAPECKPQSINLLRPAETTA